MSNRIYPSKKHNRFSSIVNHEPESLLFDTIPSFVRSLIGRKKRWPTQVSSWIAQDKPLASSIKPVITWIGHASFLVQIGGFNILLDPIFGNASPLFPRMLPPGIALKDLPPIHFVVISHNHHDHMDRASLLALRSSEARFLVPEGDEQWFERRGFGYAESFLWWKSKSFSHPNNEKNSIRFVFLPAAHWSRRGLFDMNKSLWGSWMIEYQGYRIYFAGDTAYAVHFNQIAREFCPIDIALMPIGPCEPRSWMQHVHMSAQQAAKAFLELQADHFIPMHWGTFAFGADHFDLPIRLINQWWQDNQEHVSSKKLHVVKVGQRLHF